TYSLSLCGSRIGSTFEPPSSVLFCHKPLEGASHFRHDCFSSAFWKRFLLMSFTSYTNTFRQMHPGKLMKFLPSQHKTRGAAAGVLSFYIFCPIFPVLMLSSTWNRESVFNVQNTNIY
uniref:Uncharacterized protein n=1 Tax=Hippocampus comes TaxID=109280 RepID=A0A3Q2XM88_HIPCM